MANLADIEDISLLYDYYDTTSKHVGQFEVGQIVFAPVVYTDRRSNLYEVNRSDPTSHRSVTFKFRPLSDKTDFHKKPERLPIAALALGETEELLALKAKKRPCLILAKVDGVDHNSLPEGVQRNKAMNAFDKAYLLAPIYSVSNGHKDSHFGPIMTARIKCMMYPEFVYCPKNSPTLDIPGVIRLDRFFWSYLIACSEPTPLYLSKEMMGVCWSQIKVLSGERPSQNYSDLRDLLLSELPDECK